MLSTGCFRTYKITYPINWAIIRTCRQEKDGGGRSKAPKRDGETICSSSSFNYQFLVLEGIILKVTINYGTNSDHIEGGFCGLPRGRKEF